jgi:hypothetical protein
VKIRIGDLEVGRLGFGAMRVCGPNVWGPPKDRAHALRVLRRAYELGCNFFDTADSYGPHVDEELIAEALHPYPKDLVIATKGGLVRPRASRWDEDGRPEHLQRAVEGSLRRLKLERIDLYQLHAPDPRVPFEESVGALAEMQRPAARAGAEDRPGAVGAKRIQPGEPRLRRCPPRVRQARHRLPAVVPARRRRRLALEQGEVLEQDAGHQAGAGCARLAARPVAGSAADSRDP